jgi:hypothetical protein
MAGSSPAMTNVDSVQTETAFWQNEPEAFGGRTVFWRNEPEISNSFNGIPPARHPG